jgi:hypothetical protein
MQTNYISTYRGNKFYPQEGFIDFIDIEDIAHGLAYQCRFNGQTNRFYSVAQHSCMVAELVPKQYKLAALLHDASEAYLGDIVKPLKALLPNFVMIEDRVTDLIAKKFGVSFHDYAMIKAADLAVLATEKRDLMPHSREDWSYLAGVSPVARQIVPLSPQDAKDLFLQCWREYSNTERSRLTNKPEPPNIAKALVKDVFVVLQRNMDKPEDPNQLVLNTYSVNRRRMRP